MLRLAWVDIGEAVGLQNGTLTLLALSQRVSNKIGGVPTDRPSKAGVRGAAVPPRINLATNVNRIPECGGRWLRRGLRGRCRW